ncbi:RNA recognition motif domain-containing protein [Elusimicrobiota bacterium]
MEIYVSNLGRRVSEENLREIFEKYGTVANCNIIEDKSSGEYKKSAFIEMEDKIEGQNAIIALNGTTYLGHELDIHEARRGVDRRSGDDRRSCERRKY